MYLVRVYGRSKIVRAYDKYSYRVYVVVVLEENRDNARGTRNNKTKAIEPKYKRKLDRKTSLFAVPLLPPRKYTWTEKSPFVPRALNRSTITPYVQRVTGPTPACKNAKDFFSRPSQKQSRSYKEIEFKTTVASSRLGILQRERNTTETLSSLRNKIVHFPPTTSTILRD